MSSHESCSCSNRTLEAVCLGCDGRFSLCQIHWSVFTYCSRKCMKKHRARLNKILKTKITKGVKACR